MWSGVIIASHSGQLLAVPSSVWRASSSPSTSSTCICSRVVVEQVDRHHLERELGADRVGERLEHGQHARSGRRRARQREHAAQVARHRPLLGAGALAGTRMRVGVDSVAATTRLRPPCLAEYSAASARASRLP